MMLFIDTETTGMYDFKLPLDHPDQPHLVQLAAYLAEETLDDPCRHVASINEIVRPDLYRTIEPGAERVHGISIERAAAAGLPVHDVLDRLMALVSRADEHMLNGRLIAHNTAFDTRVLMSTLVRAGREQDGVTLNTLRPFCTMQSLTMRMRLPHPSRKGLLKWPRLDEAFEFCFGHAIPDRERHSAMIDLMACRDIFNHGRAQAWWR
jgi:DNA polymerase-3 subunit epsilon